VRARVDVLRKRFAMGEITEAEFDEALAAIDPSNKSAPPN